MALFEGEDMVDVTTPDGRTLTLPRSIVPASMLPQQIAAPLPGGSPIEAPSRPEYAQPTLPSPSEPADPLTPGVVEMGEPETTPVTMMEPLDVKARPAVMKQMRAKQAAYAASPKGQLAGAQSQQVGAANAEAEAIVGAADVEAAEQAVVADAYTERNQALDKLFAKRAEEAQKNAEAEDAKMNEVVSLRKKIAGTKIDRTHDSKTMASIGMILAALGTAINNTTYKRNDENPALKIFYQAIDRKVAAQEADLDLMGKVYGMTKDEVDMLKNKSKSRLEFHNAMIAGETEKAVRMIEEITARSASEKTKANAKILIAQLQQRVADKSMEATRWGLEFDQKDKHQKAQIGLGYAGLRETKRSNMADEQLKRESIYADLQKALAADKARGDEATFKARLEASKGARERGIVGADNEYLLTAAGRAKMVKAAQHEAEAQQLEDKYKGDPMSTSVESPRIQMLRQKAAELRDDARSFNAVEMRDTADAKAVSKKYAAAQVMMDTVDEIKALYTQEGRAYIKTTKGQQELQAKMGLLSVAAKDAWELGAWDKGSAALVATIIGKDPTTGWEPGNVAHAWGVQFGKDPEGFKQRLDAVTVKLEQDVRQQIHKGAPGWDGKGVDGKPAVLFTRKTEPTVTPVGKAAADLTQARSGVEISKSAEDVGVVGKTIRGGLYPLSPDHQEEADNAQSWRYPGLSKAQEEPLEALLTAYKKGDTKAGDQLVAEVINLAEKRPDAALPLLRTLKEHAPALGTAARAGLPKGGKADEQMTFEDNAEIGRAPIPSRDLATAVIMTIGADGSVTNEDDYRELARRAGTGDADAKKAIADIVSASSKNKSNNALPKGSVFKKGGR